MTEATGAVESQIDSMKNRTWCGAVSRAGNSLRIHAYRQGTVN